MTSIKDKIAIFPDSLDSSGMGHIQRCKAIREFLDLNIVWVINNNFKKIKKNFFFNDEIIFYESIPNNQEYWLDLIKLYNINYVLIDSYNLNFKITKRLKSITKVFSICDFEPYPDSNIIFFPSPKEINNPKIYSGHKYVILSAKYKKYRDVKLKVNPKYQMVLISFGSIDSKNLTGDVLNEIIINLEKFKNNYKFKIILGINSPNINKIKNMIKSYSIIDLIVEPKSMGEIYIQSDIAIGAPGVSHIERMYCGLPTILISQNKIQKMHTLAWKNKGVALPVEDNYRSIVAYLLNIEKKSSNLEIIRKNCIKFIDGNGAKRIANIIMKYRVNK